MPQGFLSIDDPVVLTKCCTNKIHLIQLENEFLVIDM